ncbi:tRNA lysidine(34) synthetase TilS [Stenotrophomonas rhizophila]|uniref:tRNA lysidine(34) synthetase TilS n=1 Tax=Stenotrophomonas rhizophila TaxID=216778 RepID=UPI00224B6A82|nr:tRNA lysidine(34) synthetase TilS [Stenotrophomonas rhizophila]MCX2921413.1 tRNA lysidine(34) synthetase TilS [Stenotrophomonas rhizophila]
MTSLLPPPPSVVHPVLVGFSGGLDSTVLLHWLATSPAQRTAGLRAVHIHHGLQEQADAWTVHCTQLCARWNIPLRVIRVQVPRHQGQGLEAAARHARREAFASQLLPGEHLALAHHRDDQAETFLMRALRGSGVDGLASMQVTSAFGAGTVWRPLLEVPRSALRAHAQAEGLEWIEDPSNASDDADRNFLRLHVLPQLRQRWPQADAAFARSAALCAQSQHLLDSADRDALERCSVGPGVIDCARLLRQPIERRARLLRHWVRGSGLPPLPAAGVEAVERELLPAAHHADAQFAWQGARIRRWRGQLHLLSASLALPADWSVHWDGRAPLALPDGGELRLLGTDAGFDSPVQIRARRGGERIQLPGRTHSHALKDLLQQQGLPPWQRRQLPLLFDEDTLLAAGDRVIGAALQPWLLAHHAQLQWIPGAA